MNNKAYLTNYDINEALDKYIKLLLDYGYYTANKASIISQYGDGLLSYLNQLYNVFLSANEQIEINEILLSLTLKNLNTICEKEENFFKRKNKAIEYLNENTELLKNIGKHVSTRNIFKLKELPNEFESIDIDAIQNHWTFLKEYIKLISDTYRNSERNREDISGDKSWIKGFRVEKFEDLNSNFVCLRAREECKKKYSKSNPPKLPFHIGCNCDLRTEI